MSAGVIDTIAKIQAIAAGIQGVKRAPTAYPASINTSDLPMALTWAGPARSDILTFKVIKRTSVRTYDIAVYVEPVGQDTGNNRIQAALVLLERFLDVYLSNIPLAENLRVVEFIQDTGVVTGDSSYSGSQGRLIYNGQIYTGFVISLTIQETMAE